MGDDASCVSTLPEDNNVVTALLLDHSHSMKKQLPGGLVVLLLVTVTGCAAYMHGFTTSRALDRYVLVGKDPGSFGYRRMKYAQGYHRPMKEFIKTNGTPDFIWEFRLPKHRYGMRLYYVDRDIVALLIQKDRSPDSIIVQNERPLTEFERLIYSKLTE